MNWTDPVRKFHSSLLPNGFQLKLRVLSRLPVHNENSTHLIVQDLIIRATFFKNTNIEFLIVKPYSSSSYFFLLGFKCALQNIILKHPEFVLLWDKQQYISSILIFRLLEKKRYFH
jgi:hypothetical protein